MRNLKESLSMPENKFLKFESAKDPLSGAWLQASTKHDFNLLRDDLAQDECLIRIGLHPAFPTKCEICKTTKPSFYEEHGVSCGSKLGGNKLAGSIVERSVGQGLKTYEADDLRKIPKLDLQLDFEKVDPNQWAKTLGDFSSVHGGRRVIIDVTFTSDVIGRNVNMAEDKKRKEYTKNRTFNSKSFVPMVIDCMGHWGSEMLKYFDEAREERKKQYPEMSGERDYEWRNVVERISLAVCKANGIYSQRLREGIVKSKEEALALENGVSL
jgi:hypothetical protein